MRAVGIGVLKYGFAILVSLWVLLPIYFIALAAFSTEEAVYAYPKQLVPRDVSTDTMRFFLNAEGIVPSLWRSIEVALLTLVIALGVGIPAGYALARFAFRGSDAFRLGVVATRAFPIVILSIPLAVIFLRWGIDDTVYGVAIAHAALALPFAVLVTSSVFAGISVELEEAAMTLGCSRLSAVIRIILPLALPGLAAAAIFVFIISWNEVFAAAILTLRERTLPAQILAVLNASPLPFKFAGGFFLLAPSLIVIFVIRKYLFNMWGRVVR
jgi:multiple sugar transport system permease protein